MKFKLLKRINKVNEFINLPSYSDQLLENASELLNLKCLRGIHSMVYPDPNGEISIRFVGSSKKLKFILRDNNENTVQYFTRKSVKEDFEWNDELNKEDFKTVIQFTKQYMN